MGTLIEATATATAHRRPFSPGSLKLADAAARSCLERAERTADELDLLVNAGVYHDELMNEPAFASLIQEDIGANPDRPSRQGHGTFSFDVANGACGFVTALYVVDGMLASGMITLAMVVASDMDPQPGVSEGFAFPALGGAMLLSAEPSRAGFTAFKFATFPEYAELFQSRVDWHQDARRGLTHGRQILRVEIADAYTARALECADSTVREFVGEQALDLAAIDLLVATASVPGFADALAARLGVPAARVASPANGQSAAHTAAPAFALESRQITDAGTTLFVSAGAGITVAAAIYKA